MVSRNKIAAYLAGGSAYLLPLVAFAQAVDFGYFDELGTALIDFFNNILIPLFIGVAVILFFYGLIKYITSGESDDAKKSARSYMIYGVVVLFVMISVWGLVQILVDLFGLEGVAPVTPTVPLPGGGGGGVG